MTNLEGWTRTPEGDYRHESGLQIVRRPGRKFALIGSDGKQAFRGSLAECEKRAKEIDDSRRSVPATQEQVDELVWKAGSDPKLPGFIATAKTLGIDPASVTEAMLAKAERHCREKLKEQFRRDNADPAIPLKSYWKGDAELDPGLAAINPPKPVMSEETKTKLAQHKKEGEMMSATKSATLTVTEASARALLKSMGVEAENMAAKALASNLNTLPVVEETHGPAKGKWAKLAAKIKKVLGNGGKVEVEASKPESSNGKAAKSPKASANGKAKKPAKAESNGEGKDKFGSRIGSDRAKINAVLGKKPLTVQEIAEKAGLANTFFRKHMKKLVEQGFVKETNEGFILK